MADVPPSSATGRAASFTLYDVLSHLFYRRRLIRNCLLAGLALGLVAALTARTYYTAHSSMLWSAPQPAAMSPGSGAPTITLEGSRAVQSEAAAIQSDQIIRAAIDKVGLATLYPDLAQRRWFGILPPLPRDRVLAAAMERFRRDLRVETDPRSNIIDVAFRHPNAKIAIRAAQALEDAYLAWRRVLFAGTNAAFLRQQIARCGRQLADFEAQLKSMRTRYGVLDIVQDTKLATNRLDAVEQQQSQLRERKTLVEAALRATQATLAERPPNSSDGTDSNDASATLLRLERQQNYLKARYQPDFPGLLEVNRRIETLRARLAHRDRSPYADQRAIRVPIADQWDSRAKALAIENKAIGDQLFDLDAQRYQAEQRLETLREADGRLRELTLKRDTAEQGYRRLAAQQSEAVLKDQAIAARNANLHVLQPPTAPAFGRSLAAAYFVGAIVLALLLGMAASVMAMLRRRVFLTPHDAERDLSLPRLAVYGAGASYDARVVNGEALATWLKEATVGGRKLATLQIAGAAAGDIARTIAVDFAQDERVRTLIVDLRGDGCGLATALGHAPEGAEARKINAVSCVTTDLPALWVTTGAPQSLGDPLSPADIRHTFLTLALQFDKLVIVADATPDDRIARQTAGLVDANIIVLQAEQTRRADASRLRDAILAAGGNMLGFVLVGRKFYIPNLVYRWL